MHLSCSPEAIPNNINTRPTTETAPTTTQIAHQAPIRTPHQASIRTPHLSNIRTHPTMGTPD